MGCATQPMMQRNFYGAICDNFRFKVRTFADRSRSVHTLLISRAWRHVSSSNSMAHNGNEATALPDESRTRWLEREGFRVLRVWNNEIGRNIDSVLGTIYAEIYGSPDAECAPLKHRRRKRVR